MADTTSIEAYADMIDAIVVHVENSDPQKLGWSELASVDVTELAEQEDRLNEIRCCGWLMQAVLRELSEGEVS